MKGEGGKKGREREGARECERRPKHKKDMWLVDTYIQQYIIASSSNITSSTHLYCLDVSHCRN